ERILNGPTTYTTEEQQAKGPVRFIDIHVYDVPEDELLPALDQTTPIVESTPPAAELEESEAQAPTDPRRQKRLVPWLFAVLSLFAVASLVTVLYLVPLLTLAATITIVSVSQQLPSIHTTLHIVNGSTSTNQIGGRALPAISMSQQQSAPATGTGHQDATPGRGSITFYNASLSEQVIPAGTMLTGNDGVQVVTDQEAIIPAGSLATNGQTTVSASTLITGPQANIKAGDIYGPCCRANVFAANSVFSGGQVARNFQTIKPSDIDTVAKSLKDSLNTIIQAALQAQVRQGETLIMPLSCKTPQVSTDHRAGDEATEVTVTVNATCTGEVYNTVAYQQALGQIVKEAAHTAYGNGYSQAGALQTTIQNVHSTDHGVDLAVQSTGVWVYQFSQSDMQQIKTRIAGKTKAEATRLLLQTKGIQSVSITLS